MWGIPRTSKPLFNLYCGFSRSSCNPKITKKLSTRMHTTDSRMKVLRAIAIEHDLALQIDEDASVHLKGKLESGEKKEDQPETKKLTTCPAESPESSFDKANSDPEDIKILERVLMQ